MTTHEVEEMLDITKKMLIYYENEGLVKPLRDNNNYRCYNQDDISKIKFILLLREMDVTIEEIKQIINKQKSIRDVLENKKDFWIPTNHRLVKIKFHKPLLNGVHEAEPDT